MRKSVKVLLYILLALIGLILIVLYTTPRFAHTYIEDNSIELMGRKVDIGDLHFNYLTMALTIDDFTLYEANEADVFVSFDEFYINLQLLPSMRQNYTVKALLLDGFHANVVFDGEHFNFDDLVVEADSTVVEEPVDTTAEELMFSLSDVEVKNGSFSYRDIKEDIDHEINHIGLSLPDFSWNNEQSDAELEFRFEPQGALQLRLSIDNAAKRYRLAMIIKELALDPFSAYLNAYLSTQGMEGVYSHSLFIDGSMDNPSDVKVSGVAELQDFILKDEEGSPVFTNKLFAVELDSIDMLHSYYGVGKVLISHPEIYAHLYKEDTNFDRLMAPMMDSTLVADTVAVSAEVEDTTLAPIYFSVASVRVDSGAVYLADHSLNRPFAYEVTAFNTLVQGISADAEQVPVDYSLVLNKDGKLYGDAELNLVNSDQLKYTAKLEGLNLTSFSPYSEYYIGRAIKRGHMNYEGSTQMNTTSFEASNNIQINDIDMGEKTGEDAQMKVPINLALSILKDQNGDIGIDIPMTGDPSDPSFSVGRLVVKTLTDFIVKVAASPFALVGNIAGVDPERMKQLPLDFMQDTLLVREQKTLEQIALALEKKPELIFRFTLEVPVEEEMKALALRSVKHRFIRSRDGQDVEDEALALALAELKDDDEAWLAYLQQDPNLDIRLSVEEQCVLMIGEAQLKEDVLSLNKQRKVYLQEYLLTTLSIDPSSIVIRDTDVFNQRIEAEKPLYRVEVSVK